MQAYVCKEVGIQELAEIIYLSPMHITERAIIGHDIPDTDPLLENLTKMQRLEVRADLRGEIMYRKGQYVLQAMHKIQGNGCILAAHQFGYVQTIFAIGLIN